MRKILYIGGSPCSGKSIVSDYLSRQLGCQVIRVDDYMGKHIEDSDKNNHPIMYKWKIKPWHQLFTANVNIQFKEQVEFYNEEWPLLKKDIEKDIANEFVIIEGCALMPSLIKEMVLIKDIIYMVPTEEFQKEKFSKSFFWIKSIF